MGRRPKAHKRGWVGKRKRPLGLLPSETDCCLFFFLGWDEDGLGGSDRVYASIAGGCGVGIQKERKYAADGSECRASIRRVEETRSPTA